MPVLPHKKVTFPVTGNETLLNVCRTVMNADEIGNLTNTTAIESSSGMSFLVMPTETQEKLFP